jgi:glycosyltransferase involved in cell wall biosynthesis
MFSERRTSFLGAELRYLPFKANGISSVPFDILSLVFAAWRRSDAVLLLGVSGAIALPLVRLVSHTRIVTNVDGLEWKRLKWGPGAQAFLKFSERMAVRWSHEVIADNPAIADHLRQAYGRDCPVIPYGGEHVVEVESKPFAHALPPRYALAISRIEPENNPEAILKAFARRPGLPLLYFGNWDDTRHGRNLKLRFSEVPHLQLLDAEHDQGRLRTLREEAEVYIHGHSAGGTNPSLVEAMHFGRPVIACDCAFNRHTTLDEALYFTDADSLGEVLDDLGAETATRVGAAMRRIARERYLWPPIAAHYFKLLTKG